MNKERNQPTQLQIAFPAEWEPQSGIQLTWPHEETDWAPMLDEVSQCYAHIVREITRFEPVYIITPYPENVLHYLNDTPHPDRIALCEVSNTNDTWARDHGGITVMEDGHPVVCDFVFNGWGMKYPAHFDNLIVSEMARHAFASGVRVKRIPFVLEGGSIESDGRGTLLTTASCIFSPNRNDRLSRDNITAFIKEIFGADRLLILEHGHIEGDDTDGHVDTLARFCDPQTIAYVQCTDPRDIHFDGLQAMERELRAFRTADGEPYRLIPLPIAEPVYNEDGEQLPATYANFLILNGALLVPAYGNAKRDEMARQTLRPAFSGREIISIDCLPLIKQGGAIHCATMQYPAGTLNVTPNA